MKAKDLIGCLVTRTSPCETHYGKDGSYVGDKLIILNADDELIAYQHASGSLRSDEIHMLGKDWCDDNWMKLDNFLEKANFIKVAIHNIRHV